ncbi:MAG: hypothetical protein OXE85_02120 [Roseovarius sp.]|nr:hypothetical protein [Roseovarius sp.]
MMTLTLQDPTVPQSKVFIAGKWWMPLMAGPFGARDGSRTPRAFPNLANTMLEVWHLTIPAASSPRFRAISK